MHYDSEGADCVFMHSANEYIYIYMLPLTCHQLHLSGHYDSEEADYIFMHSANDNIYMLPPTDSGLNMPSASFASSPVMNARLLLL